jgi:hypothetical protein
MSYVLTNRISGLLPRGTSIQRRCCSALTSLALTESSIPSVFPPMTRLNGRRTLRKNRGSANLVEVPRDGLGQGHTIQNRARQRHQITQTPSPKIIYVDCKNVLLCSRYVEINLSVRGISFIPFASELLHVSSTDPIVKTSFHIRRQYMRICVHRRGRARVFVNWNFRRNVCRRYDIAAVFLPCGRASGRGGQMRW